MTQDNIQKDTSQGSNEQQYNSLEEAVFGDNLESSNNIEGAFTSENEGNTETVPTGQPGVSTQENVQEPTQTNDETRYQYWQSQADKYKNELDQVRQQQQAPVQPVAPAQPAEPQVEEFPASPPKPQKPRTFNREEAYSDPNSESAGYLDELEGWRDDISEYNSLKSQYQTAVIEEKFNKLESDRVTEAKKQQAFQQQAAQEAELKSHVMGHYGMKESEVSDFMSTMSDPSSVTIDNLVQLYRMKNSGAQQDTSTNTVPSEAFTQTKNAQQVPSPMGVMPSGQNTVDGTSLENKIMDNLIGNFNSKNPWK